MKKMKISITDQETSISWRYKHKTRILDRNGKFSFCAAINHLLSPAWQGILPSMLLGILSRFGNSSWHDLVEKSVGERFLQNTSSLILLYCLFIVLILGWAALLMRKRPVATEVVKTLLDLMLVRPIATSIALLSTTLVCAFFFAVGSGDLTGRDITTLLITIAEAAVIYAMVLSTIAYICYRVPYSDYTNNTAGLIIFSLIYILAVLVTSFGFWCEYVESACTMRCGQFSYLKDHPLSFFAIAVLTIPIGYIINLVRAKSAQKKGSLAIGLDT
ncbi:hypothetical protein [Paraburkholderia sp. JHI869]|uniref:hypothetical protein n=1 Tax=Paraburkholderia sp. JHI869 TaxID=3112959 RepID=UPI003174EF79